MTATDPTPSREHESTEYEYPAVDGNEYRVTCPRCRYTWTAAGDLERDLRDRTPCPGCARSVETAAARQTYLRSNRKVTVDVDVPPSAVVVARELRAIDDRMTDAETDVGAFEDYLSEILLVEFAVTETAPEHDVDGDRGDGPADGGEIDRVIRELEAAADRLRSARNGE